MTLTETLQPRESSRELEAGFDSAEDSSDDDVFTTPAVDLDEDTFGMTICALTRDVHKMALEGRPSGPRIVRLITTLGLVVMTIFIQIMLLVKVKEFVTARRVHDIREAYDKFELQEFGNHTTLTANGRHRGIDGFFPSLDVAEAKLGAMSAEELDAVCRIPLSQPDFFLLILFLWTLTCMTELRKAYKLEMTVLMLETTTNSQDGFETVKDDEDNWTVIVRGLTIGTKALITCLTFLPRVGITLYLLWQGCRWLLATNCFSDLILNALALEFILLIKEGIYAALMPDRNRYDLGLTKITPYPLVHGSNWVEFVNTVSLGAVALGWCYLYMHHFQTVLPGYKWDVHEVCKEYIKQRYAV